ncbi:MAG: sulfatase-like hydrolase/transferase [Acidobacteria bacterium]|nr:sulfatase-like hydrolase/transferase [Acidobacteriota bacterium]
MALLIVGLTIVVAVAGVWRLAGPRGDSPIVLISIDTLRTDHLPAYGYRLVATPAIDALASDGVLFEHAYAHSPQTLPSHTSILTGRLPFEHGVRDNIGFTVKPGERLLSRMLHERGFVTGGVVSAYVLRQEAGIGQGFDFYDSQLPIASPELSVAQVQRDGAESLAIAERWMSGLTTRKFFLFLHFYEPHKPYEPPARYAQYQPYDGEIAYADELVGKLVQTLKSRDLYDRATIVFLADHGEGFGDHGEQEHGVFLYDETIRVPLVIKMPGSLGRGRRVAEAVQHIDLVPTLLDLAGAPRPAWLRGRTLRPILEREGGRIPEQGLYAEALYPRYHFGWSELYSLTDSRYRYIKAPRDELYDLQQDPAERRNLSDERTPTRLAMRAALDRMIAGKTIDAPTQVSGEDRERLQALGYVGMQANVPSEVRGESLPDPKDKAKTLETYRRAVDFAGQRKFDEAIALFRAILAENPAMTDVWSHLANILVRAGKMEDALATFRHLIELNPKDSSALIGASAALLKLRRLDEAAAHAELAVKLSPDSDRRQRASAYETLIKVALARKDREAARRYADLAQKADPTLPMPIYVQALLLHVEGKYAEALPLFEETLRQLGSQTVTLTELHFYVGDTLARLGRNREAEAQFRQELNLFPQNTRAWASLAMLYRSTGRDAEVAQVMARLVTNVPTVEGYTLAEHLWTMFGEPSRAQQIRALAGEKLVKNPPQSTQRTRRTASKKP